MGQEAQTVSPVAQGHSAYNFSQLQSVAKQAGKFKDMAAPSPTPGKCVVLVLFCFCKAYMGNWPCIKHFTWAEHGIIGFFDLQTVGQ